MPSTGTTALVIELPAAEVLLDAARRVNPALVRTGLPAHVTVLYPFLPAAELTDDVERAVAEIVAAVPAMDVQLAEIVTTPGFVAVAVPALQPLADAVCARWPDVRPYGGRFGSRPPVHLTVVMGANDDEIAQVSAEARRLLPVEDKVSAVQLVELTGQGWRLRLTALLGRAAGTNAR